MKNKINPMLLSDVEDQIKELFTGNEIIALTNDFANSIGEHVTFQSVNFNSRQIVKFKLNILVDRKTHKGL